MDENNASVYDLVTKLCDKVSNSRQNVPKKIKKKLRSLSYEILLSKRIPEKADDIHLENNKDPFCHLLAWQFVLINEHDLQDHSNKLQKCVESLRSSVLDKSVLHNILCVLLQLKSVPEISGIISVNGSNCSFPYSKQSRSHFRLFDESKFTLQLPGICVNSKYSDESFYLKTKRNIKKSAVERANYSNRPKESCPCCARFPSRISCRSSESTIKEDEGYESPTKDFDIWDIVANSKFTDRRTWETIGNPLPNKEGPFLSETTAEVCALAFDYQALLVDNFMNGCWSVPKKVVTQKLFIHNVKFLLVGMTSDTFVLNSNRELTLVPGTVVIGITPARIELYCKDLIFCGSCYKALNEMCNLDVHTQAKLQHEGFIFRELCESIKRYLSHYRIATLSISESGTLLSVHQHIKPLMAHLDVLTSICKVGPFSESERLPNGVALLNYLYQKVTSLSDKDVVMVLCSILYPCIQVYFRRFLQQWIFEGIVNDPYDEFFICITRKFLSTRGRTYWTRSYMVQEDIVPEFLNELFGDILSCGKAMNLLKLVRANSPLCVYLMGKKPSLLSCCLTPDQLLDLKQNTSCYYLEVISECGPVFSFSNVLTRSNEQQIIFMNLITRKRSATLKRLEMEKLKATQDTLDKKQRAIANLKAQYDEVLEQKKQHVLEDIEKEIKVNETNLKLENLRKKLIQEEADDLIEYYDKLMEISERRRLRIEKHIDRMKKIDLDGGIDSMESIHGTNTLSETAVPIEMSSSSDTFLSASSDTPNEEVETKEMHSSHSLDVINANSVIPEVEESETAAIVNENFRLARMNKAKVMASHTALMTEIKIAKNDNLTELQRNRFKVMSSEFGISLNVDNKTKEMLIADTNKQRNMRSNECFYATEIIPKNDNENFINCNIIVNTSEVDKLNNEKNAGLIGRIEPVIAKPTHLKLDFGKISNVKRNESIFTRFLKSPNFELEKSIPMSVDSTPCTDGALSTPRMLSSFDRELDSLLSTGATNSTDVGFNFDEVPTRNELILCMRPTGETLIPKTTAPKCISSKTALGVSPGYLKLFIQESVSIPLNAQIELVNNELLKYFTNDLHYLTHLNSLRNYFFLLDGEFGRNITEGLFEKLYDVNFPIELINCHTLQHLVYNAMNSSIKLHGNVSCLSFKINDLPNKFNLINPDVLGCLSLTYNVAWPLNILLPSDTIAKYDEVFKFLLKLHLVSWVLKKILQDLKMFVKKTGRRAGFLTASLQFKKLHQCRHIMTHFVQTLQNYVIGEVLRTSWDTFEKKLALVKNLDELYHLHTSYIKNILFMCLLNQRSAPIRLVIHKIFILILKFYHFLRSKEWVYDEDDGMYVHPNFVKLERIFLNLEKIVVYLCKASAKVAKVGYQPQLVQLVDMLNVNNYYTKKISSHVDEECDVEC